MADSAPMVIKAKHTTRIVLEDNPNIPPTGQFIGVNGKGWLLRAGEEADVPQCILETLDNAIEFVAAKNSDGQLTGVNVERRRFSYRVVRE